ncbi:Small auxin-up RNA - like 10 [Theobroma cacao]|nr:Small auxin-up RNA - like 10 [Theobroma cacao]
MAWKWQKMTVMGRKRISFQGMANAKVIAGSDDKSSVAEKGHFVIYTTDQKRHVVPLAYLSSNIFLELLKLSRRSLSPHSAKMIKAKRLIELARKWQKMAAIKRRRISFPKQNTDADPAATSGKGHFGVYTTDKKRFVVPLKYLNTNLFRELLKMSEEVFGIPADGPITLPCDSTFLVYITPFTQGRVPEDLEKALLTTLTTCHCSAPSLGQSHQEALICGY